MTARRVADSSRKVEAHEADHEHAAPVDDVAPPSTRTPYVPSLDGLRALAIVAVIAYHLGHLRGGYLGVDLFFVVSGYLITSLLLAETSRRGRVSLRSFWANRARRLLPALLVVVVAVMVATRAWEPSWRWPTIRGDALATLFYVENWRQIFSGQSYFNGASPFRHAWSLSVEEQFYLVWPLLIVAVLRLARHRARAAVGVVATVGALTSAAWMAFLAEGSPDASRLSRLYLGTDTRAMTVLTGAILAVLVAWRREADQRGGIPARWRSAAGVAAVPALGLAAVMIVRAGNLNIWMYRGGFVVFAGLSAALVLGCVGGFGPLAVVLAVRPLRWVGRLSYALYLWSWPTQLIATDRFELRGARLAIVVVVMSTVLAVLTTELVERPIRYGTRLRGRRWVGPVAVAGCAALVLGLTVGRVPAPDYTRVSDKAVVGAALDRSRAAPRDQRPLVMVAGDSVAWSMGWDTHDIVPDVRIEDRALIGCGTMPSGTKWIARQAEGPQPYPATCSLQSKAEATGLAQHPDVVVFGVGAWEVFDQLYEGRVLRAGSGELRAFLVRRLNSRVAHFIANGAKVIIPLVPCYGNLSPPYGPERDDPVRRAWMNGILLELAAKHRGSVTIVDPTPLLCTDQGTQARKIAGLADGDPRPDGSHYDLPGRRWLWAHLLTPAVHRVLDAGH